MPLVHHKVKKGQITSGDPLKLMKAQWSRIGSRSGSDPEKTWTKRSIISPSQPVPWCATGFIPGKGPSSPKHGHIEEKNRGAALWCGHFPPGQELQSPPGIKLIPAKGRRDSNNKPTSSEQELMKSVKNISSGACLEDKEEGRRMDRMTTVPSLSCTCGNS